jgi:hypothetical protein
MESLLTLTQSLPASSPQSDFKNWLNLANTVENDPGIWNVIENDYSEVPPTYRN